ncbi:LLM class F420-dependent oxidoreductase [Streptomyces arenae]|uniref:LLM class F420-dependent oxidoreductase n=1 Tax=Streptomyces arenae TaxID=29301 RepID=UPI00265B3CA2|nr:LLM class F420-dependent oxidoreductase [Streptomyces arenae]MCG7208192.1 LLM class F420-dependent oxidoreductase [Streptomyces arenae]
MTEITSEIDLGAVGVWRHSRTRPELAAEVERLGYGTLWLGNVTDPDLAVVEELLDATERLVVATGIVNIWSNPAERVARAYRRIAERHADRFLLGVGAGHPEATKEFVRPYQALNDYLDVLDKEGVPVARRALAALGPRVLRLAAERTAAAHPYLVTPEHTRQARGILGAGPLLAPEQKVVLETDRTRARAVGDATLGMYLGLRNYVSNLRRLGFDDTDFADGGSDRLFDALILHGDPARLAEGLRAHLDAGADHVTLQLLHSDDTDPLPAYRELAAALGLPTR